MVRPLYRTSWETRVKLIGIAAALCALLPAAALAQSRQGLDEGRASVMFPHGPPQRIPINDMTLALAGPQIQQQIPELPLEALKSAEVWVARDPGETSIAVAMPNGAGAAQAASCPSEPKTDEKGRIRTCKEISEGSLHGKEWRTTGDQGRLVIVRELVNDGRAYVVSYARKHTLEAAPDAGSASPDTGEAFVESLKFEPAAAR
jgi:hypothetical protein